MSKIKRRRREFLQIGAAGIATVFLGTLPKESLGQSLPEGGKGIVIRESEGIQVLSRRKVPINIKISKVHNVINNISFCVEDMSPVVKCAFINTDNDELIFIHKGRGTLTLDEQSIEVKTGDVVFVPRGIWHGLDNTGKENLLMVFQYSPAGFEEYFIENGTIVGSPTKERTDEEYKMTEKKYGMVYKDEGAAK
jgi:mannose-6-phosphate isomerase-like protein (cupin superfamily)